MSSNINNLDQGMREAIHVFLRDKCPPSLIRELHEGKKPDLLPFWQEINEMGLCMLLVPESAGGLGLKLNAAVELAEEAGMCLLPVPLTASVILAPILYARYSEFDAGVRNKIDEAYRGVSFINFFNVWDQHRSRIDYLGYKSLCLQISDNRLNFVKIESIKPRAGIDKSILFSLIDTLNIKTDESVCEISIAEAQFIYGGKRLLLMAELLGVATKALDLAIDYACEREQFGKPIGANQALKHNLANNWMAIDNSRLAIHKAAASIDENSPSVGFDLDAAQLLILEAAKNATSYAKQIYGAMGITWECDVHMYLKRSRYLCAQLEQANPEGLIKKRIWSYEPN